MAHTLSLKIGGMHCGGCVNRVTQALKNVPGIEVEDVQVGSARVRYEEEKATLGTIQASIRKIGFDVHPEQ